MEGKMPRQAAPRVWRQWYVTEAGGKGLHKLCLITDGKTRAKDALKTWLAQCREEQNEAQAAGLVQGNSPFTLAQVAAEFLQWKETTKKASTFEF
jgi:hypothetical protein